MCIYNPNVVRQKITERFKSMNVFMIFFYCFSSTLLKFFILRIVILSLDFLGKPYFSSEYKS